MERRPTTYWVWRRSDGYISGSAYDPRRLHPGLGETFEILLHTDDWYDKAVPLIEAARVLL